MLLGLLSTLTEFALLVVGAYNGERQVQNSNAAYSMRSSQRAKEEEEEFALTAVELLIDYI